uniref:Uncharacterized protein n=1 Tax=Panagrolaimus superbus TaxID=310955 RepID=A0A914YAT0_9BILA
MSSSITTFSRQVIAVDDKQCQKRKIISETVTVAKKSRTTIKFIGSCKNFVAVSVPAAIFQEAQNVDIDISEAVVENVIAVHVQPVPSTKKND